MANLGFFYNMGNKALYGEGADVSLEQFNKIWSEYSKNEGE